MEIVQTADRNYDSAVLQGDEAALTRFTAYPGFFFVCRKRMVTWKYYFPNFNTLFFAFRRNRVLKFIKRSNFIFPFEE